MLVILAGAAAVLAPIAVWARRSLLDTDHFTGLVAPMISDETVARSLSGEVADRLFVQLEVQKRVREALKEALPDKLDFLAGPIAGGLQMLTQRITYEVITSPQFQAAWEKTLRLAHSTVIEIIRGDRALAVNRQGEVVLDAGELMRDVRGRLLGSGLGFLERATLASRAGEIVLFRSSQLKRLKTGMQLLDALNWMFPLLFLACSAAAVLISEDRRKTCMGLFIALAAAMLLSVALVNLAEGELLAGVKNPSHVAAARVVWDRLTAGLVRANLILLVLGMGGALACAVAGPYAWAGRTRRKVEEFLLARLHREPAG
jgi:hypothetical protein